MFLRTTFAASGSAWKLNSAAAVTFPIPSEDYILYVQGGSDPFYIVTYYINGLLLLGHKVSPILYLLPTNAVN